MFSPKMASFRLLFLFLSIASLVYGQLTQLPYDPSPFVTISPIQAMTVDDASDPLSGGTITVQNIVITVPKNLLVTLPNIYVSWPEVFKADGTPNLPLFGDIRWEASIVANRIGGQYIAGMVFIFQEFLHESSGFITAIDYATGELRIGGTLGDATTGTRVVINDPIGRFAPVRDEWPLWTIDYEFPSVKASTGFPLCFPKTNPATSDDPLCPSKNRPVNAQGLPITQIEFSPPPASESAPDPDVAAPLMVGDWVVFSGIQVTTGTDPLYAAYALEANLGFYTAAGTAPVYLTITRAQWGIIGNPAGEIAETRFEGYTTDESQPIEVYAIDVDPCTGIESTRVLAVVVPRTDGRRGQWRYRTSTDDIEPATREVGARVQGTIQDNANNITTGNFVQPVMDEGFIWPELVVFGQPEIVYDFDVVPFLARGMGPWLGGIPGTDQISNPPIVGQLDPWPGAVAPSVSTCAGVSDIPVANAGVDIEARSGVTVTLRGSTDSINIPDADITFAWTQSSGPTVALTGANTKTATFTAPTVSAQTNLIFTLTTTTTAGSTTDTVTVTVTNVVPPDTLNIVSMDYSNRKGAGQLTIVATTDVTDGSSVLSLRTFTPNTGPTVMTHQGGGRFQLLVNVKPEPASITVTSSRGGTISALVDG
ncbi:hypothetical protein EDC01DRAFT_644074 [Geopyxis carbonaria]|nr:hypothetical protein EDC01DRAFT_644074 [Geopyxis carbonaria]